MTRSHLEKHARSLGSSLAVAMLLGTLASSCDESGPRVFTAQHYRADLDCLDAYAPLGLVEAGFLGALCEPVCLVQDDEVFVSSVCAPYPAEASVLELDAPDCVAALAASSCDDAATIPDAAAPNLGGVTL